MTYHGESHSRLYTEELIVHGNKETDKDREKYTDKSTGLEMEQAGDPQSLLEWFTEKYKEFGANLEVRRYPVHLTPPHVIQSSFLSVCIQQKPGRSSVRERFRRHWGYLAL